MLAQSFQAAADLGISEAQKEALMKTLVLLETGKLEYAPTDDLEDDPEGHRAFSGKFNMSSWAAHDECGTVCCIGGTAEIIGNVSFGGVYGPAYETVDARLHRLFYPEMGASRWSLITPAQAARALRSYLTTGDAKWAEAVA